MQSYIYVPHTTQFKLPFHIASDLHLVNKRTQATKRSNTYKHLYLILYNTLHRMKQMSNITEGEKGVGRGSCGWGGRGGWRSERKVFLMMCELSTNRNLVCIQRIFTSQFFPFTPTHLEALMLALFNRLWGLMLEPFCITDAFW